MTKEKVLALLKSEDDFISGEHISEIIGVSRMAVSSAVKALRNEGYDITSVTNRGYRLNSSPDSLSKAEVMSYVEGKREAEIICLESVDSTNKRLKEMALEGKAPDGLVIIANEQTSGRGRLNRSFISLKDKGIYISMIMRPHCSPADAVNLTAWTAVAVQRAVKQVSGCEAGIKWVNDLLLGDRKICGILTEMSIESESGRVDYCVVGIGVNVNNETEDFPEELRNKAGSLYTFAGRKFKRAELAAALIKELDDVRMGFPVKKREYLDYYRNSCTTIGRSVSTETGHGTVLDINEDFSIKIRFDDGQVRDLFSGEITIDQGLYR